VSVVRGGGGRRRGAGGASPPRPGFAAPPMGGMPPPMGPPMGGPMGPPMSGPAAAPPMTGDMGGYGPPPPMSTAPTRGVISGAAGVFTVSAGLEMRVGRDGAACQILLTEPRVSGSHATLKFEQNQLLVRDESSNNGTYLNGQRIQAG